MRKTRYVVALGLSMALGVSGVAFATGATENEAKVVGKVTPKKLEKKKFKKVNLLAGVDTRGPVTGMQENPEAEYISFSKNIKLMPWKAPMCTAQIENLTTEAAKAACPRKSNLGSGTAEVQGPGGFVSEPITVTAFNGPGKRQLRLHTYSDELAGATPTVQGFIVQSTRGRKYRQALSVPDAPDAGGDAFMITHFDAKIKRKSKVVSARCKAKKMHYERLVTYDDGSTETAKMKQKCKRKKSKR